MLFPRCFSNCCILMLPNCQIETESTETLVQQRLLAKLHASSPHSPKEKAANIEAAARIAMLSRSVSPSSSHSSPQHRPNSHSNSPNSPNVLRNGLTEREKYIEDARFFGTHNNRRQSSMSPDKEDMYILHELSHANRYAADSPFFHKNVPPPPMAPSTLPMSNISKETVSTLQSMINISKQPTSAVADVSILPLPLLPPPPLPSPPPSPPPPPQPFFNEKALPRTLRQPSTNIA